MRQLVEARRELPALLVEVDRVLAVKPASKAVKKRAIHDRSPVLVTAPSPPAHRVTLPPSGLGRDRRRNVRSAADGTKTAGTVAAMDHVRRLLRALGLGAGWIFVAIYGAITVAAGLALVAVVYYVIGDLIF